MTNLRSERLKKWTVGLGRHERDRIRALEAVASNEAPQPKPYTDEIVAERGVQLLLERGGAYACIHSHARRLSVLQIHPAVGCL